MTYIPYSPPNLDAFNRDRVSNPETQFDSKQLVDKQPLYWDDQQVSGSGTTSTYNTNQASTTIAVSNLTAGKRVRQTYRWFNYQTGKSQLVLLTGVLGVPTPGITRRAGQFNNQNGYMMLSTPTSIAVGIRSFTSGVAVDNVVNQANWNLDKLNGTGPSGITLDMSKTQIEAFQYQWLGVGAVLFVLVIDGKNIPIHQFNHANQLTVVYTSSPNLPLRYEIENDGTGPAASLTHICSSVITEGGRSNVGFPFGIDRGATALITNNDTKIYPLLGIRLKSAYLSSSIEILDFSITCTSTAAYNFFLLLNPTIVGVALNWVDITNSSCQKMTTSLNTTTVTGGIKLFSKSAQQTNDGSQGGTINTDFAIGSNIAGVSDIALLCVQRVTGTAESFYGSMNFKDQQ